MPFFRRANTGRSWLRNLPTVPIRTSAQDVYYSSYTYSYSDYYGYETEYSTISSKTPIDRSLYPSVEAYEKIKVNIPRTPIIAAPHSPVSIDLNDMVEGSQPIFFFTTKRPYWILLKDGVLSGRVPSTHTNETVQISVLVENPASKASIDIQFIVLAILNFIEGNTYKLPLSDFFAPDAFSNIAASRIQVEIQELRQNGNPLEDSDWVGVYDPRIDTELTAEFVSASDDIYIHVPIIIGELTGGQLRIKVTIND